MFCSCYLFDLLSFVSGEETEEFCLNMLSLKCTLDMQMGMFNKQLGVEVWCLGRKQAWRPTFGSSLHTDGTQSQGDGQTHPGSKEMEERPPDSLATPASLGQKHK